VREANLTTAATPRMGEAVSTTGGPNHATAAVTPRAAGREEMPAPRTLRSFHSTLTGRRLRVAAVHALARATYRTATRLGVAATIHIETSPPPNGDLEPGQ